MDNVVTSEVSDGVLTVTIKRQSGLWQLVMLDSLRAVYLKSCRRQSSSRANRTITVRKRR